MPISVDGWWKLTPKPNVFFILHLVCCDLSTQHTNVFLRMQIILLQSGWIVSLISTTSRKNRSYMCQNNVYSNVWKLCKRVRLSPSCSLGRVILVNREIQAGQHFYPSTWNGGGSLSIHLQWTNYRPFEWMNEFIWHVLVTLGIHYISSVRGTTC